VISQTIAPTIGPTNEPTGTPEKPPIGPTDIISPVVEKLREFIEVFSLASKTTPGQAVLGFVELLLAIPLIFGQLSASSIGLLSSISNVAHHPISSPAALPRRKRKGYVFDFQSKKPIGLARVKIFSVERDNLVYQDFTNREGEFAMLLPEGEFYLTVEKRGYRLVGEVPFSQKKLFDHTESDGYYDAIYYPESIIAGKESEVMSISIPLQQLKSTGLVAFGKLVWGALRRASYVLFVIGTLLTISLLIIDWKAPINIAISIFYLIIWVWLLYNWMTYEKKPGQVLTAEKVPLPLAIVRAYDKDGRLLQTAVTDETGNFIMNLSRGQYSIKTRKPGYKDKQESLSLSKLEDIGKMQIVLDKVI
jgi:hypothetical protein